MSIGAREEEDRRTMATLAVDRQRMRSALHALLRLKVYDQGHSKECCAGEDLDCPCSCGYGLIVGALR